MYMHTRIQTSLLPFLLATTHTYLMFDPRKFKQAVTHHYKYRSLLTLTAVSSMTSNITSASTLLAKKSKLGEIILITLFLVLLFISSILNKAQQIIFSKHFSFHWKRYLIHLTRRADEGWEGTESKESGGLPLYLSEDRTPGVLG